jgi:hypothetical protein
MKIERDIVSRRRATKREALKHVEKLKVLVASLERCLNESPEGGAIFPVWLGEMSDSATALSLLAVKHNELTELLHALERQRTKARSKK